MSTPASIPNTGTPRLNGATRFAAYRPSNDARSPKLTALLQPTSVTQSQISSGTLVHSHAAGSSKEIDSVARTAADTTLLRTPGESELYFAPVACSFRTTMLNPAQLLALMVVRTIPATVTVLGSVGHIALIPRNSRPSRLLRRSLVPRGERTLSLNRLIHLVPDIRLERMTYRLQAIPMGDRGMPESSVSVCI